MIQGNWFIRLSLCGVTGWAALIWALGRQDKTPTEARSPEGMSYARGLAEGLGQRAMLWLASLAGFYSLIWLLDNVPTRQQEAKVIRGCHPSPAHFPRRSRHDCSVKSSLKSLGQVEQELVTLLYKLHKHKVVLQELRSNQPAQSGLPNDLVIYCIKDET